MNGAELEAELTRSLGEAFHYVTELDDRISDGYNSEVDAPHVRQCIWQALEMGMTIEQMRAAFRLGNEWDYGGDRVAARVESVRRRNDPSGQSDSGRGDANGTRRSTRARGVFRRSMAAVHRALSRSDR